MHTALKNVLKYLKGTMDRPGLDDPIWEYILLSRLTPYLEPARRWWANVEDISVTNTGIYTLEGPPGFMMRFTRSPVKSPIKGIQAFPFVTTGYLQLSSIQGGALKMIERICLDRKCKLEEFTLIEKHNLPSLFSNGQFIAFVPSDILEGTNQLGSWLYLTPDEMSQILKAPDIPNTVKNKLLLNI
jgi:hypothetical protein